MKTPNATHTASPKRQREIIAAALACFIGKGFPATSIADICKKAGPAPAVFTTISSKGRLAAIYLEWHPGVSAGMIEALLKKRAPVGESLRLSGII
ncbi:MAG: TetR/AcrR family transcriptional regulator [Desulfobacterales bacterium]